MAKIVLLLAAVDIVLLDLTTDATELRISSSEFARCPSSDPIEHGSLRVVSQDDVDVNAVYVKFGRPPLQIVRRFISSREALEVIDIRLLNYLDRSKPIYLVDNSMNLNGTRCDVICCRNEKGALAFEETAGFSDSCSRLQVDDGARCEVKWLDRVSQGVCKFRPRMDATNEQWVECQVNALLEIPSKLSQQPLKQSFDREKQITSSNGTQALTPSFQT